MSFDFATDWAPVGGKWWATKNFDVSTVGAINVGGTWYYSQAAIAALNALAAPHGCRVPTNEDFDTTIFGYGYARGMASDSGWSADWGQDGTNTYGTAIEPLKSLTSGGSLVAGAVFASMLSDGENSDYILRAFHPSMGVTAWEINSEFEGDGYYPVRFVRDTDPNPGEYVGGDAVLAQYKLKTNPSDPVEPFGARVVGFCTGDHAIGPLSIDGGANTITFQPGWIEDEISVENSADISQGKGFFASAITGSMQIPDATGDGRALSAILYAGGIDLIGAEVRIATVSGISTPTVIRGPHLGVVDYEARDGAISVSLKSLSYLENKPMFGVRTATELLTGPDDPTNPTDPTYLDERKASQFAGVAFGGREVSLKAADPLTACKVCFYAQTTLKEGEITATGTGAFVVGSTAGHFFDSHNGSLFSDVLFDANLDAVGRQSYLHFWCRDNSESPSAHESDRFLASLKHFAENGYRIVVSDGNWFLDLSEFGAPDDVFGAGKRVDTFSRYSSVPSPSYAHDGLIVSLDDILGGDYSETFYRESFFPIEGLTPESCSFYAIPDSIAVASIQCIVRGFARDEKTISIGGDSSFSDRIQTFSPAVASADSYVGATPVPGIELVYEAPTFAHLGAIESYGAFSAGTLHGAGDLKDVAMDPASRWSGSTPPATFGADLPTSGFDAATVSLRIKSRANLSDDIGDIYSVETTNEARFTTKSGASGDVLSVSFGPLEKWNDRGLSHTFAGPGPETLTISKIANVNPKNPRWQHSYKSLSEMAASTTPMVGIQWPSGSHLIEHIDLDVMECFVYAYSKFSMSSIYSTIYPFWTGGKCSALAANGDQILSDSAIGTIAADGSIAWAPFTLPTKTGQVPRITGACRNGSVWILVGYEGSPTSGGWTAWKANDGAPWIGIDLAYTAQPKRCRRLGGKLLVMFADGTLQKDDFTTPLSLGFALNDAAHDSGVWIICGAGGAVYRTTNFATFDSLGVGGFSGNLNCATFFDGRFYVAGSGGAIFRATPTQILSADWEDVSVPTAGTINDIVASGTSIVFASAIGIFASNDGATWVKRTSDIPYSTAYSWGWNFGLAHTTFGSSEAWIMGSSAQVFTSMDVSQGGASAPLWVPHKAMNPGLALEQMRARYFGGVGDKWNPIQWTYGGGMPTGPTTGFGIAFDPPSASQGGDQSGTAADKAASQICEERWMFAGEMPSTILDGSSDNVQTDLPEFALGNPQDIATLISIQYQPFGGAYLSTAYVQNVDIPYVAGNDPLYFDGWGSHGLAIWQACRAAYLKTGILRSVSMTYDSVHDAETLGEMWTTTDSDLGQRLRWLIDRPRYFSIQVDGNESQAAQAFSGARYKPNTLMLAGRGLSLGGTGYGVVVDCSHRYVAAEHSLTIAFPPQGA